MHRTGLRDYQEPLLEAVCMLSMVGCQGGMRSTLDIDPPPLPLSNSWLKIPVLLYEDLHFLNPEPCYPYDILVLLVGSKYPRFTLIFGCCFRLEKGEALAVL